MKTEYIVPNRTRKERFLDNLCKKLELKYGFLGVYLHKGTFHCLLDVDYDHTIVVKLNFIKGVWYLLVTK